MLRRVVWIALAVVACSAPKVAAQNLCSTTAQTKVACTLANVYGVNGLTEGGALAPINQHEGVFGTSFLSNLSAVNSSIGAQLGELPLVSPASGISFSFNKSLGILVPSEYNFGPILSERASTLGRHKLLVGFSYQYFEFQTLDGLNLNSLPAVFTQQDSAGCSVSTNNAGSCAYVRDVITTRNAIDLRVNQYTAFVSFGLTSRFDISVAVPTINVRMAATSEATIRNIGSDNQYSFLSGPGATQACTEAAPCFNRTFFNSSGATGVGDVTVRAKYELWKGENAGFAVGTDVRFPTGDALNYLGSGAYGVKPFAAVSFGIKRVSAHVNAGYEWNGSTFLAGDITPLTGAPTKNNLPGQFVYSAGAEIGIIKRLSVAFDFLGQEFFNAPRIKAVSFPELGQCLSAPKVSTCNNNFGPDGATVDPNVQQFKASYATEDVAAGLRFRLFGHFLLTGNVLFKVNDAGLRSKYVPLVGITYSH